MARFHSPLQGVRRAALALSLCVAAAAPAFAEAPSDPGKVLATVNGEPITAQDYAQAQEDVGSTLPRQMNDAARKKALMDYLIDLKLVTQKALADKLDQTPDFKQKMAYYREKLLMESYLGQIAKTSATEAALKTTYDEAAKAQKPEEEVHALHILVPTEKEAEDVEKRLKAGEDFGKLADQLSKDPGSKGGDLGWFTKDRMVPEFAEAAFKLQPGQISPPVKTQFGWHVIKVLAKREKPFPPMAQVRDQLEHFVAQRAQSQAILKLRDSAKITRTDAPPAAAAAKPEAAPAGAAAKTEAAPTK
ncbi:peptidylprolyl isomerase [Rhodoblastus acidophilus]|uniref:Parvulin-like PPIase n=1 Tax=Candidatus Rhodoblastus alkanivorans TaxID=2954117 RepID=A0ABS9Z392_9HYPH|nr:peptidylprolyl isomerase [Candidatus Rhodoblastus alkanivorans]MCI4677388.1 peptidylprolyl isomerase [Candidatus Rhodoblastus alkanivorans]MCI4682123.1 peptidylprolyl isomerase [Candidatus Rhodoblastus alkanivorans]MDI4639425.1 peptidylprolyl isomerase [Rhodoblastus acidophilus]